MDSALVRAGRIHSIVELKHSTKSDTMSIMKNFYGVEIPKYLERYIPDKKFTPAEITDICCSTKSVLEFIKKVGHDTESDSSGEASNDEEHTSTVIDI